MWDPRVVWLCGYQLFLELFCFFSPFIVLLVKGDVVHFLLLSILCFNNKHMCDLHLFVFVGLVFWAMYVFIVFFFCVVVLLEICVRVFFPFFFSLAMQMCFTCFFFVFDKDPGQFALSVKEELRMKSSFGPMIQGMFLRSVNSIF